MHAVVTLACGLLLCACFDSHDAEVEPAPRKHRAEAGARSPEPSEPAVPQTPDGLDWHAVYFVRRTAPLPGCGAFQVAALGTPEAVRLTIDCWADSNTMTVSPGGAIYFLAQPGPRLQVARCDEGCREAAATRGVPVDTPACDAERHNPLEQVLMGPDGAVMYACSNGSWHDEHGDLRLEADERYGKGPWHLGRDRLLFTSKVLVDLATGDETEIRGFDDWDAFRIVRLPATDSGS